MSIPVGFVFVFRVCMCVCVFGDTFGDLEMSLQFGMIRRYESVVDLATT